jgi:hypothetical protein
MATTKTTSRTITKTSVALWTTQGLLAALFLFAGTAKLTMPIEMLTESTGLPAPFMQFISVCEILGGLGLVLPGILRMHTYLTPLAALGLATIMVGATTLSIALMGVEAAPLPCVTGVLCTIVAYARRSQTVGRLASRGLIVQPAS